MYIKFVLACAIFLYVHRFSDALIINGYYWRVFDGEIPHDAVIAGSDVNGLPVYIGQILYGDKLLPAKIYYNDNKAYFAWGTEQSSDSNVKILCSPTPEKLQWVKTKKNEVHMFINKHLISGGYEPSYTIYIGRSFYKGETLPGRVRTGERASQNLGLYISSIGKEIIFDSFEILTYEPDAVEVTTEHCHKAALLMHN
ncbi:hypothetical protein RN001_013906 [Aquatica leii]|uniref:Uncharacterized protein n=1 Tax=Aquatica leii TaxID=1421715 RepID=A0AAN7S797_9COLE|nr:hypothetical protein RN001_013906 [Aquatica leii]